MIMKLSNVNQGDCMGENLKYKTRIGELLMEHKPEQVVLRPEPRFKKLISPVFIDKPGLYFTSEMEQQIENFIKKMPFPTVIQREKVVGNTININFINLPNTA